MGRKLTPTDAGVTLIELLVVVAVLAVLAVGVSITVLRGPGSGAQSDMAMFQGQFQQHRALAITSSHRYGMFVTPKDMRITQAVSGDWANDATLRRWRARTVLALRDPKTGFDTPDIIMLPTGQSTAFDISFGPDHRCSTDGWGPLICNAP